MIKLKNAGVNDYSVGITGVECSSRIGCGGGDSGGEVKNGVVLRVVMFLTVV